MASQQRIGLRRGMEARDLLRIRWVSDAQIAPSGERVAFVVTTLDGEGDRYLSAIWMVETASNAALPRQFTCGGGRDTAPRWSPDGRSLAFLSERNEGKAQIYVMPADGGEPRCLTSAKLGAGTPVWSPDSQRLCFAGKVPVKEGNTPSTGPTSDAEPTGAAGTGDAAALKQAGQAPPARVITTLKYKLNAEGFTYDRHKHLFVVDVERDAPRQVTDGEFDDDQPCWTPDGAALLFVSARHAERDYDHIHDVFRVPAEGGEIEQITDSSFAVDSVALAPDGGRIVFSADRHPDDPPRHTRLWLLESGAQPNMLVPDLDRNAVAGVGASGPLWSPDGNRLLVTYTDRGNLPVVAIDVVGGSSREVIGGERSVASFSLDGAGKQIAFIASTADAPAEVFVAQSDGSQERRLTGLNDEWLAEVELSTASRLQVCSGDGTAIDAWLMRPSGYQPGAAHPLLLNIHGGPFSQYGNTFLDEFQVQAGAGFGVLFCNPRGSSGYGEEFARAIVGETGIKDSEDVLASLDHALAQLPDIDNASLGVLGGSYGGYLTSWIVGHSDRFAAACSERAINNRLSKAGTDDVYTTRTYFRDEVWRNPELFLRLSPLMFAEQMRTPLLIMHSEEDLRCPIEQAEQLFVALKRLRRDVVFVRFPGENHELSRNGKPSHRMQRFDLQIDFFRRHLQS